MGEQALTQSGFPPASLVLLGAIVGAYPLFLMTPDTVKDWIYFSFAVFPARFAPGSEAGFPHWYDALGPLIGHVFLHGGWIHLLMNVLVFFQGAPLVERRVGAFRFLVIFFISAAAGAAAYVFLNQNSMAPAVGASGAICGIFGAYFLTVGRTWREALRMPAVRNGIVVFLGVNVGLAAVARMTGFIPIAWEAHLGGFIGGAIAYALVAPRLAFRGPWERV